MKFGFAFPGWPSKFGFTTQLGTYLGTPLITTPKNQLILTQTSSPKKRLTLSHILTSLTYTRLIKSKKKTYTSLIMDKKEEEIHVQAVIKLKNDKVDPRSHVSIFINIFGLLVYLLFPLGDNLECLIGMCINPPTRFNSTCWVWPICKSCWVELDW